MQEPLTLCRRTTISSMIDGAARRAAAVVAVWLQMAATNGVRVCPMETTNR
jgi:hypothetical protein